MKHNKYPQEHKLSGDSPTVSNATATRGEADFAPAAGEVARRAYFAYVNQGSRPGHDVQHWLEAEVELIAERNRTRVHGFHNQT